MASKRSLFAVAALAAVLIGTAVWVFRVGAPVDVDIGQGATAGEVGRVLKEQGVIASPALFKAIAKATGLHRALKPGTFRLRRHMSSPEALWRLTHDRILPTKVSIPEGWNAKQIAERLEANGITPPGEFLAYAQANRLEGYLFPTTYFLHRAMRTEDVARMMRQEFDRQAGPIIKNHPPMRLKPEHVVTMASIVEREAVLPQERPTIAAVYLNRLEKRMRLEADPTVQYALGYWKKGLTHADLATPSPYNTYANRGLPPGPICSPSLESIKAVLAPAKTNALYFVANNTGGHTFNETFEEHLKAKDLAAKERRRNRLLKKQQQQQGR